MVLMGRRRIGKTSLIIHALADTQYAYLFVARESEQMPCAKFQRIVSEQLGINIYGIVRINHTNYADIFFDFYYAMTNLLNRKIDLVDVSSVANPFFKQELQETQQLIYG